MVALVRASNFSHNNIHDGLPKIGRKKTIFVSENKQKNMKKVTTFGCKMGFKKRDPGSHDPSIQTVWLHAVRVRNRKLKLNVTRMRKYIFIYAVFIE